MATDMMVSKEILRQLGGNRFIVMTGAKGFVGSDDALSFQLPKASKKIKGVRITLNKNDLYDLTFGYMNKKTFEWVVVASFEDVYNDNLVEIFEKTTGLYTKF